MGTAHLAGLYPLFLSAGPDYHRDRPFPGRKIGGPHPRGPGVKGPVDATAGPSAALSVGKAQLSCLLCLYIGDGGYGAGAGVRGCPAVPAVAGASEADPRLCTISYIRVYLSAPGRRHQGRSWPVSGDGVGDDPWEEKGIR